MQCVYNVTYLFILIKFTYDMQINAQRMKSALVQAYYMFFVLPILGLAMAFLLGS